MKKNPKKNPMKHNTASSFFACPFTLYFIFFLAIYVMPTQKLFAQKQANIWYFGENAGFDFNQNKPLTDGKIFTDEGCVVISDKQGNLLFYTDGKKAYNRRHELMADSLKGDNSSTQSGIVIPFPKQPNIFILFTVGVLDRDGGLSYSLVDMTGNNGLGIIPKDKKNINLVKTVTEKLTSVKHRNGKDTWVLVHGWGTDEFMAFLVTENGVSTTPIISNVGSAHKGETLNSQGYMKLNADGTNLALALEGDHQVEIFDFDSATGKVTNPINIQLSKDEYPYGIEFSPNGSLLYVTGAGTGSVFQINLQASSVDEIKNSVKKVGQTEDKGWIGALQLASDGKIYFPIYRKSFLGVIQKPNELGENCGHQNEAVALGGKLARLGLPSFIQSDLEQKIVNQVVYFNEQKVEFNKFLILKNVNFEFSKANLLPISFIELNKALNILKQNPTYKITLSGHTDNVGNKSSNLILSDKRANAVSAFFQKNGIQKDRITTQGFGSGSPLVNNDNDANRLLNRRVEMMLVK